MERLIERGCGLDGELSMGPVATKTARRATDSLKLSGHWPPWVGLRADGPQHVFTSPLA
jgi:hypothetical protein